MLRNECTPPRFAPGTGRARAEVPVANTKFAYESSRPSASVTKRRLRSKAGHRQVMDGPFAETKEGLGGFYLIEAASKAEAVEWAKKIPLADGGFIDVVPVWEM